MPVICRVTTRPELAAARRLFEAYARSLPFALDFQGFQVELDALPGAYAPPGGCILLARADERTRHNYAGCVALRPLTQDLLDDAPGPPEASLCEMKRLYVRPAYRGEGLGRALGRAVIEEARRHGYDAMRLDTVASMTAANALYRSLGFHEIGPYCHNPLDDPVFFEKRLARAR